MAFMSRPAETGDAVMYFVFGLVALLASVGDLRMLTKGGVTGSASIARHLWRMCIPLFIAVNALFLARARFFPLILQMTHVLFLLSIVTLGTMIFWLARIRSSGALRKTLSPRVEERVPKKLSHV